MLFWPFSRHVEIVMTNLSLHLGWTKIKILDYIAIANTTIDILPFMFELYNYCAGIDGDHVMHFHGCHSLDFPQCFSE